jgi:hypothetical protein
MTESEAFAAIALATVACDGVLGKDEAHALRRQLEYRTPYTRIEARVRWQCCLTICSNAFASMDQVN